MASPQTSSERANQTPSAGKVEMKLEVVVLPVSDVDVVSNIEAARAELVSRGANVSEVFHYAGLRGQRLPGADPEGRSYRSLATFSDPDGNGWLLQEIKTRLPGRV
jgi:hypothetical protein